jgi:hypothetical protein
VEAAEQFACLFSGLTRTPPPPTPYATPRPRKRGRRRGDVENYLFQDFVFDLLMASDGKLKPNKEYREKRTLRRAVEFLRPSVPDGFIPKRFSESTLQRIQKRYNDVMAESENPGPTRTGQAARAHPALGQDLTTSPTARRGQARSGVSPKCP